MTMERVWLNDMRYNLSAKEMQFPQGKKCLPEIQHKFSASRIHFLYSWEFIDWSQFDTRCLASEIQRLLQNTFSKIPLIRLWKLLQAASCNDLLIVERESGGITHPLQKQIRKVASSCLTLKGIGNDDCSIPGNRRRYLPDLMQSTSTSLSASSLSSVSLDSEWESGINTNDHNFSCASWIRCDSVDAEKEAETSSDNRRRAEEPVQPEQQQQRSRADGTHQPTETAGEWTTLSLLVTRLWAAFSSSVHLSPLCMVMSVHPTCPKTLDLEQSKGTGPPACELCMLCTLSACSACWDGRAGDGRGERSDAWVRASRGEERWDTTAKQPSPTKRPGQAEGFPFPCDSLESMKIPEMSMRMPPTSNVLAFAVRGSGPDSKEASTGGQHWRLGHVDLPSHLRPLQHNLLGGIQARRTHRAVQAQLITKVQPGLSQPYSLFFRPWTNKLYPEYTLVIFPLNRNNQCKKCRVVLPLIWDLWQFFAFHIHVQGFTYTKQPTGSAGYIWHSFSM